MDKKIKVAVIGTGIMGAHHARVYNEIENAELVAVSDLDENIGKKISEKNSCKYYKDYNEMLDSEDIEAVSISVPTKFHKAIALGCVKKGKHILIEKPVADTIEDAKEIITAANDRCVRLMVGHIERFNPAVMKLKDMVQNKEFGKITSITARRVGHFPSRIKDANVVIDITVHDVDVFNYLLNKKPTQLFALAGRALNHKREDYTDILLKYNGTNGFIQSNWITPVKIRELVITGTKGYATLNYITQEIKFFESIYKTEHDDFGDFVINFGEPKTKQIIVNKEEPLKVELRHFLDVVSKNELCLCNGEDGYSALKICFDIIKSYEKDKNINCDQL